MADRTLQIILAAKDITGAAFNSFEGKIARITKSVFSFRGALAALAGTGGIGLLVTKSVDAADAIAKTADKLGLATKSLQEYRYGAELSGVETHTLDLALQRFTRRTAEAAQGKGELIGVLKQYNIAVRDAAGNTRSNEAVLRDLADAIARVQDPSERLRIAFKAFDSEGASLVNMLRNGSSGLDAFAQRANELGVILDDKMLRGAEKAKDAMSDHKKVMDTSFSNLVLENIDAITEAVKGMTIAAQGAAKVFRELKSWLPPLPGSKEWNRAFNRSYGVEGSWDVALGGPAPGAPFGRAAGEVGAFGAAGARIGPDYNWAFGGGRAAGVVDRMGSIEERQAAVFERARAATDDYTDFWRLKAQERYEVQSRALDDIVDAEESASNRMVQVSERAAAAMQRNFSDLFYDAFTGELDSAQDYFQAFSHSIIRIWSDMLAEMLTQWAATLAKSGSSSAGAGANGGGFWSQIAGFFGSSFGGGSTGSSSLATTGGGGSGGYSYDGGGHIGERVRGIGLMSGRSYEFHANETVVPDGSLAGGGVNITVHNYSGLTAAVNQRQSVGGSREFEIVIGRMLTNGGPASKALQTGYGLKPVGRPI